MQDETKERYTNYTDLHGGVAGVVDPVGFDVLHDTNSGHDKLHTGWWAFHRLHDRDVTGLK